MAYEVKITDETALKISHPDLFSVNLSLLKKRLVAAKTLGQTIPGATLIKVDKIAETSEPKLNDIPAHMKGE